jgi:hypothetical protein
VGVRWGELVALRRANIDLGRCEIRIVETTAELDRGDLLPRTAVKSESDPDCGRPARALSWGFGLERAKGIEPS